MFFSAVIYLHYVKLDSIFIHFTQVVVYFDTARKQSKKHKSALAAVFVDGCPANTSVIHTPEIVVPPVPATDIVSSKIIHITYELKVNVSFFFKLPHLMMI